MPPAPSLPPAGTAAEWPPELQTLQRALAACFAGRPRLTGWGDVPVMRQSLEAVNQAFGRQLSRQTEARIGRALLAFAQGDAAAPPGQALSGPAAFLDLKYACYGLMRPLHWGRYGGDRILDHAALLAHLLHAVESWQHDARRYRQCLRGLLAGYLESFETSTPLPAHTEANRAQLAAFLRPRLPPGSLPDRLEQRTFSLERKFERENRQNPLDFPA